MVGASFLIAAWLAPPYTLEVERDTTCPQLSSIPQRVEALLSHSTSDGPAREIEVKHGGRAGRHTITLSIDDGSGSQRHRFRGNECESLVPAAALLIAVTLDPLVLQPTSAPPIDDEGNTEPQPAESGLDPVLVPAPTTHPTEAKPAPEGAAGGSRHANGSWGWETRVPDESRSMSRIQLRSSLGSGVTPALNFGVRALYEHRMGPRFSLGMGAHHDFERVQIVADDGSGAIGVQAPVGVVRACFRGLPEQWEFSGCVGGDAGAMITRSIDVATPLVRTVAWGTANASAGLRWPRRAPVALALDLEGWVGLGRPTLKFPGITVPYRPSRGGVRGLLGVEIRLGKKATQ